MTKRLLVVGVLILVLVIASGCKDITDSFRPGSFGNSPEEAAMVDAITERYGDLTQGGDPRFLEVMMTTQVDSAIPVDKASKYSQDTKNLYVWFVYDNFNEDIVTIEWIYLDDDYSIHTFEAETGKDFGRGTFILEQPEDGWPTGRYKVILRGRGIEESITFEIIEGATVAVAIPFEDGKVSLPSRGGWYLKSHELVVSESDVTIVEGGRIEGRLMGTSSLLYDYYTGTGGKNDYSHSIRRTDHNNKTLHSGSNHTIWTDPPAYLAPGEKPEFSVTRIGEGWGTTNFSASFDLGHLKPGYGTAGHIKFRTPQGDSHFTNYQGMMMAEREMPEGKVGDERAIIITLGNGYGYRYLYQWRD